MLHVIEQIIDNATVMLHTIVVWLLHNGPVRMLMLHVVIVRMFECYMLLCV